MPSNVSTQTPSFPSTLLLAVQIEPQEIGRRLAVAREAKGWTQFDLANEASVSVSSIQRWESGKLPPVRELVRMAGLLDIETDELVTPTEAAATDEEFRREVRGQLGAILETVRQIAAHLEPTGDPRAGAQGS